jgi:hypothetical protein
MIRVLFDEWIYFLAGDSLAKSQPQRRGGKKSLWTVYETGNKNSPAARGVGDWPSGQVIRFQNEHKDDDTEPFP